MIRQNALALNTQQQLAFNVVQTLLLPFLDLGFVCEGTVAGCQPRVSRGLGGVLSKRRLLHGGLGKRLASTFVERARVGIAGAASAELAVAAIAATQFAICHPILGCSGCRNGGCAVASTRAASWAHCYRTFGFGMGVGTFVGLGCAGPFAQGLVCSLSPCRGPGLFQCHQISERHASVLLFVVCLTVPALLAWLLQEWRSGPPEALEMPLGLGCAIRTPHNGF